jgi:hypothetical protein
MTQVQEKTFGAVRIQPRALHMLSQCSTTKLHPQPGRFLKGDKDKPQTINYS